MKELFQSVVMRLALCGLAVSLALFALRSRMARDTFARLLSVWRSLTAFGRVAVCSFLLIGVLIGSDKTNGVLRTGLAIPVNPSIRQSANLSIRQSPNPAQCRFAARWASNWNVCEVVSYGEVWATPFGDAVASLGVPVEIVPGLSSFGYEHTPSNSYCFVWTDAAINRDTNNLVTASIELFRDGGVCVTTNGVAAYLPRELPFEHHGYGQDAEWVAANFTNATEILSVGYPQWVDAQVGTSLTNGLYKLTINVADYPPETTQISVGNLSIAVTNAGEYVFLLGKGIRYDLSASSECATNFEYCAVDDIVCHTRLAAGGLRQQGDGGQEGVWSSDSGELRLSWPFEFVEWKPTLSISPQKWNPSRANAVRSFTATLTDIPWFVSPSYTWSSADSSVCTCDGAQDRTATFTCKFPAAYGSGVSLALDVMLNRTTLHADYWRYIGYFSESEDYEESIDDCDDCEPNPGLVVCGDIRADSFRGCGVLDGPDGRIGLERLYVGDGGRRGRRAALLRRASRKVHVTKRHGVHRCIHARCGHKHLVGSRYRDVRRVGDGDFCSTPGTAQSEKRRHRRVGGCRVGSCSTWDVCKRTESWRQGDSIHRICQSLELSCTIHRVLRHLGICSIRQPAGSPF